MSDFKQTNLYLDTEVVLLSNLKLKELAGKDRMLSFFVNQILEEFALDDYPEGTSIKQISRQLTEKLRKDRKQQKKIIQDSESLKVEREAIAAAHAVTIEQVTRSQVARQTFTKAFLPEFDDKWSTAENIRKRLVDEIAHECQMDLQWRDVEQAVRKAVQA